MFLLLSQQCLFLALLHHLTSFLLPPLHGHVYKVVELELFVGWILQALLVLNEGLGDAFDGVLLCILHVTTSLKLFFQLLFLDLG